MYFLRARLTDCIPMSGGGFAATTGTKSDLFASFNPCTGPPSFWPCMSDPSRRLGLSCMGSWMSFFSCVVTCTFCTAASLFDKRTSSSANSFRRHAFTCELSHAWIFSTLGNSLGAGPWQLCMHAWHSSWSLSCKIHTWRHAVEVDTPTQNQGTITNPGRGRYQSATYACMNKVDFEHVWKVHVTCI